MKSPLLKRFVRDDDGAVLIENTVTITAFFLILFGIIDFSNVYYQWNGATKATQHGARLAAVSDPIDTGLRTFTGLAISPTPGDPLPAGSQATIVCRATNAAGSAVTCDEAIGALNAGAMQRIVYGAAGRTACVANPSRQTVGMCNFLTRIRANNVEVQYAFTGLGFSGRPGGAVPTITVRLRDDANALPFQFIMVGALANLTNVKMPPLSTTVTGEDLNIVPPPP